jgi:hypothetical protein
MRYTVCSATDNNSSRWREDSTTPSLLFETLDVEKVAALPELAKIFSNGYFVSQVAGAQPRNSSWWGNQKPTPPKMEFVLVSTHLAEQLPDDAKIDTPDLQFFLEGKPYTLNLRQRYNRCLSLFKAVGCTHCPDKGMKCLSEGVGIELPARLSPAHEAEDLWEHVQEHYTKLGEFTLVKPGSTRTEAFSKAIRPYWEHDFDATEKNHKKRSEASTQGADTKRFKKTQCVKCPIKDSCDRASHCKGAYPPEASIIEEADRRLTAVMKASPWPEWQLWEIARHMGETAKVSRWNVVLTGLKLQGTDGVVATVHRAKGSITEFGMLKTYEDIAKAFGLALIEADVPAKRGPVKDPTLRALLWLTLKTGRGYQATGWGNRRYITAVGCNDRYVSVLWTNGNWISRYTSDLTKISQVASHLSDGRLGDVDKVEVRP